jgi:hypothetical protein
MLRIVAFSSTIADSKQYTTKPFLSLLRRKYTRQLPNTLLNNSKAVHSKTSLHGEKKNTTAAVRKKIQFYCIHPLPGCRQSVCEIVIIK